MIALDEVKSVARVARLEEVPGEEVPPQEVPEDMPCD